MLAQLTWSQPGMSDDAKKESQYIADGIEVPPAHADEPTIKLSIGAAAKHLDDGAKAWSKQRNCVSCHTNGTYLFIRPSLTKTLGPPVKELREFFVDQLKTLQDTPEKRQQGGTRPAQVIYIAAGLAEWDQHVTGTLSPETKVALELMFKLQLDTGTWKSLNCWPPFESSAYQEATMAAMAVASAPTWLQSLEDESLLKKVSLLKRYVADTRPPHDYARLLQLWTSLRLDGILNTEQQDSAITLLSERQQKDGSWSIRSFAKPEEWGNGNRAKKLRAESDFETPAGDGHMTGLALLILQERGIHNDDKRIKKGLDWLKSNQRESGRWWTRSLNTDKSHFITYSGTAYPLLALQRAAEATSVATADSNR